MWSFIFIGLLYKKIISFASIRYFDINWQLRDTWVLKNGWIFGKLPKGGVVSDPKHFVANFFGNCEGIFRRRGGGGPSNPKNFVADFTTSRTKSATLFSETRAGAQRLFGSFPKINPFWRTQASLIKGDFYYSKSFSSFKKKFPPILVKS